MAREIINVRGKAMFGRARTREIDCLKGIRGLSYERRRYFKQQILNNVY